VTHGRLFRTIKLQLQLRQNVARHAITHERYYRAISDTSCARDFRACSVFDGVGLSLYRSAWQTGWTGVRRNNRGLHRAHLGTSNKNRRQTDQRLHRGETRERLQKMDEVRDCSYSSEYAISPIFTHWSYSAVLLYIIY